MRYLTGDEPEQAAKARTAAEAGEVFVSTTVLLESERVLRSVYCFAGGEVAAGLRATTQQLTNKDDNHEATKN